MATNLGGLVKRLQDIMRNDPGINGDAQRIEQIIWALFLKVYDAKEEDWEMDEDDYQSIIPEPYRWRNWAHDDGSGTARTGEELLDFVTELFSTLKNLPITPDMPKKKRIVKTMFEETNQYMKDGVLLRQVINVIDAIDLESYDDMHALGDIYETILKELQSAGRAGEFYTPRAVTDFMADRIEPHLGEQMADFACGTGGFLVSWLRELEKQIKMPDDQALWNNSVYGIEKKQFPYMLAITNLLLHGIDNPNIDHGNSLLHDVLDYTERDKFDKILMNPPYGGSEKKDVMSHFPDDLADSETADLFMSVILYRLKQGGRAAVVLPDGFLFGTDNTKVNIKKKLMAECDLHTIIRLPGSVFAPYTSITTNILFFDRTHPTEKHGLSPRHARGLQALQQDKAHAPRALHPVKAWWDDRQEILEGDFPKAKCYTADEIAAGGYNLDLCGFPHEEEEILEPMELIQKYQEQRKSLNDDIDKILARITAKLEETE